MPTKTNIEWTDYSANLIRYRDRTTGRDVWACVKHSPGCKNCYAESLALRFGKGGPFTRAAMEKVEPYFDVEAANAILRSRKLAGQRVFIGDMTDVFGDWIPDELLTRLFTVFALRQDVTFQVLTKRPERMRTYLAWLGRSTKVLQSVAREMGWSLGFGGPVIRGRSLMPWPLPNVWLGTSVEDQQRADERIPELLQVPAKVRFLSVEPLLGPVDLSLWLSHSPERAAERRAKGGSYEREFIDWVIVGGESGGGARPCQVEWMRSIVAQCQAAGVPCFVKQLGAVSMERMEYESYLGDERIAHRRIPMADRKGGDMANWPEDLRVRQFPEERS